MYIHKILMNLQKKNVKKIVRNCDKILEIIQKENQLLQ